MAAPQRNYPYNPHLARAALFNRNDPHFSSIISNFDSDGGDEDQVLPSALPPAGHGNQEAQGINTANNSELDAATGGQNTLPTPPVESASVPGAGAAHEAANQTLTDDVAETTAQLPTATAHSAPASGEADTDMDVPQEAISLRSLPSKSQPEAGTLAGTSRIGHSLPTSPTSDSDTAHKTASTTTASITSTNTTEASTSRRLRKGAATPDRQPRRSIRETAQKTAQILRDLLAPRSHRGKEVSAAANGESPSTSTPIHTRSAPQCGLGAAPTSNKGTDNNLDENAKDAKTGLSAVSISSCIERLTNVSVCFLYNQKGLGKRRRVEPANKEEQASDEEEASPSKKARRAKNLRNRSTPAQFDIPREEPASPNPFLVTPARKRALDEEENEAGPSKRGRFDLDGKPLATPRTPSLGPARTSPAMEQPRRSWSVQAQPSLPIIHTPQALTGLPQPTALNAPLPDFVIVIPDMPPLPLNPATPPVPALPGPLRRTFAKIFVRARPSRQ